MYWNDELQDGSEDASKKKKKKGPGKVQKGIGTGLQVAGDAITNAFAGGGMNKLASAPPLLSDSPAPLANSAGTSAPLVGPDNPASPVTLSQETTPNFLQDPTDPARLQQMVQMQQGGPNVHQGPPGEPGNIHNIIPQPGQPGGAFPPSGKPAEKADAGAAKPPAKANKPVDDGVKSQIPQAPVSPRQAQLDNLAQKQADYQLLQENYKNVKDTDLKENRSGFSKFMRFLGEMGKSALVGIHEAKLDPSDPYMVNKMLFAGSSGAASQAVDPAWDEKRKYRYGMGLLKGEIDQQSEFLKNTQGLTGTEQDLLNQELDIAAKAIANKFNMDTYAIRNAMMDERWIQAINEQVLTPEAAAGLNAKYGTNFSPQNWSPIVETFSHNTRWFRHANQTNMQASPVPVPASQRESNINMAGRQFVVPTPLAVNTLMQTGQFASEQQAKRAADRMKADNEQFDRRIELYKAMTGRIEAIRKGLPGSKTTGADGKDVQSEISGQAAKVASLGGTIRRMEAKLFGTFEQQFPGEDPFRLASDYPLIEKMKGELAQAEAELAKMIGEEASSAKTAGGDTAMIRQLEKELAALQPLLSGSIVGTQSYLGAAPPMQTDWMKRTWTKQEMQTWLNEQREEFKARGIENLAALSRYIRDRGGTIAGEKPSKKGSTKKAPPRKAPPRGPWQ